MPPDFQTTTAEIVDITAGDVNIYPKNAFLETGTFTQTVNTTVGSISSIYDADDTTYYQLSTAEFATVTLQWNMGASTVFKNIYVYVQCGTIGGGTTFKYDLDGSANGTDWTNIATRNFSGVTEQFGNLLGSSITYQYIRIVVTRTGGAGTDSPRIYTVKGVI